MSPDRRRFCATAGTSGASSRHDVTEDQHW